MAQAAGIISKEDPSIEFKLIGSGQTFPHVRDLATELHLENIQFEGWLPQRELPQRIASADICLGIFGKTEKAGRVVDRAHVDQKGLS